ncbi:hypothetical protein [Halorarius halobius]|uniref:hypothetical protein n=1 Tax=Halorarius halobius TaxID=2962671 RepID=UPI0020CD6547|nr:hypothetical protein [Halorarius halobius]
MPTLGSVLARVIEGGVEGVVDAETAAAADRLAVERRLAEPPAAFVDAGEVDAVLAERFPPFDRPPEKLLARVFDDETLDRYLSGWEPGDTAVREGALYVHPERFPLGELPETPPVERTLGVRLDETDLTFLGSLPTLSADAVATVREAVADRLGGERKAARRAVAEAGYPRPVVDSLEVETGLTFAPDLGVRLVDARTVGPVERAAMGRVRAKLHFEGER